jgi:hypothetical protein
MRHRIKIALTTVELQIEHGYINGSGITDTTNVAQKTEASNINEGELVGSMIGEVVVVASL